MHQYCCSGLSAKEKKDNFREIPEYRSQLNKFRTFFRFRPGNCFGCVWNHFSPKNFFSIILFEHVIRSKNIVVLNCSKNSKKIREKVLKRNKMFFVRLLLFLWLLETLLRKGNIPDCCDIALSKY